MALAGSLDTNVVVRLIRNDVPEQHHVATLLLQRGTYAVADLAVAETGYVLTKGYGMSRVQAALLLTAFVELPQVFAARYVQSALVHWADHPKLSLEDCLLVQCAVASSAEPLWTFDRKLANQSSAMLVPQAARGAN